uniref:Neuropeptide n=1 Tax=Haemonchus contortus TaxID=6289 RepID=A0A7I4YHR5_HAECO
MFHAIILALLATAVYAQFCAFIDRYSRYRRPYPQPAYSSYDEEFDILQDELLRNFDRGHFRDKVGSAKMKEDLLRFFDRRRFNDRPEPEHFNDEELLDKVQRQLEQLAEWERMNNRRRFLRKV